MIKAIDGFALLLLLLITAAHSVAQTGAMHEVAGLYAGNIPCGACPDIDYRISLLRDGTYEERVIYSSHSTIPITVGGNYSVIDNSIVKLHGSPYSMGVFRIMPSALQMLDANGQDIPGTTPERYTLAKLTRKFNTTQDEPEKIMTAPLKRRKYHQGITFYAAGNEPSWSLDITKGKSIEFKTMDGNILQAPYTVAANAMDANVIQYHLQTEAGTLQIKVAQQPCSDNMSGEVFNFKVSIELKPANENESRQFEGCGNYVPDFGLEGRWTLKEIGSSAADEKDFSRELPYLEINIDSSRYSGYAGCNRINGMLNGSEQGWIRFEDGAMTMMACSEMNKEQEFIRVLKQTTHYKITNEELELSNPGKLLAVFKRMPPAVSAGYRVIDIWVLESFYGKQVDLQHYRKELPRLEINSSRTLTGFTGCNNMTGTVEANENNIKITVAATTRMACNEAIDEKKFIDGLREATTYNVANNKLILMKDNQATLVFRKVD